MTKDSKLDNKGFTLVEAIVMIAFLGILAGITVPKLLSIKEKTEKEVCKVNCLQVEKIYHAYLIMQDIEHTEAVFEKFLREYDERICTDKGIARYVDGKVRCNVHTEENDVESNDKDDGSVPFL